MRTRWPRIVTGAIAVLGIGLAVLIGTGTIFDGALVSAGPLRTGSGLDPLTRHEESTARALVDSAARTDADGKRKLQYLYSERHEPATSTRRADVYLYDYTRNHAIKRVVNLATDQVEGTTVLRGQPSIADAEARQAVALLLRDERFGPTLRRDFERATGKALTSPGQIEARGLRFSAAQGATAGNRTEVARCGIDRCLQLFAKYPNGQWVDASRIVVDLSARRVHVLEW